jgi:hypothetical protein
LQSASVLQLAEAFKLHNRQQQLQQKCWVAVFAEQAQSFATAPEYIMQQLSDLSSMLQPVGMSNLVKQHCLYPGQRRTQLVQAMLTRCGGRDTLQPLKLTKPAHHLLHYKD